MSRPEKELPAELFYNDVEANKYSKNSRILEIQVELAERAMELLDLENESSFILDVGCGSGISGNTITELGHIWTGVDISQSMLAIAKDADEGELILSDIGQGLPFKGGIFDGAISISAIQWLCYSCKKSDQPKRRLKAFFSSLYACLKRDARAVLQFYPENIAQMTLIQNAAVSAGFSGGLIIDYPNSSKNRKHFLVLSVAPSSRMPEAKNDSVVLQRARAKESKGSHVGLKDRKPRKKDDDRHPSKYSGRKRKPKF